MKQKFKQVDSQELEFWPKGVQTKLFTTPFPNIENG